VRASWRSAASSHRGSGTRSWWWSVAKRPDSGPGGDDPRRVTLVPGGPMLVEGPVDVVFEAGTAIRSERPVVAICACRRSKRFPFCDTSHRERARPDGQPASGSGASSED